MPHWLDSWPPPALVRQLHCRTNPRAVTVEPTHAHLLSRQGRVQFNCTPCGFGSCCTWAAAAVQGGTTTAEPEESRSRAAQLKGATGKLALPVGKGGISNTERRMAKQGRSTFFLPLPAWPRSAARLAPAARPPTVECRRSANRRIGRSSLFPSGHPLTLPSNLRHLSASGTTFDDGSSGFVPDWRATFRSLGASTASTAQCCPGC